MDINKRMKVHVLGCYGAPALGKNTTAFLLDDATLIDGGTIISVLNEKSLSKIRRIFLSHAHLDHIKDIPFFISAARAWYKDLPIEIYALESVIEALDEHLFNGVIWPDFYRLPDKAPLMKYVPILPETPITVGDMTLTLVMVNHTVPCAGMLIEKNGKTLAYSADTITTDRLWELASQRDLSGMIVEVSFPSEEAEAAKVTRHYTPGVLVKDLVKLKQKVPLLIFHLKPEYEDLIRSQLDKLDFKLHVAEQGRTYVF